MGITCEEIEDALSKPVQIVPDDLGVWVTQRKRGDNLLRVPFVQDGCKILTVYWTCKVDKYWREE